MTPVDNRPNDTKLLLGIAGLVVLGAAGIALLAGWSVSEESETRESARSSETRRTPRRVATTPAMPASHEPAPVETAAVEPIVPTFVEPVAELPEIDTQPETPFVPQPDENFVARGVETFEAREYDKAVAYWRAEVDARPQRAWSQYMLGLSHWKNGELDEAAAAMQASIAVDGSSVKSFVNLARIENDRGDHEAALEAANAGLVAVPDDPSAHFLAARSLYNLDRFDEAETELVASLAGDPENGYAQNLLGLVFLKQERDVEAIVAFEKAAELRPETAFIRNNLGMALELGGERSEAIAAYRKAVELDPSHTRAASNLERLAPGIEAEPTTETTAGTEEPATDEPVTVATATGGDDVS